MKKKRILSYLPDIIGVLAAFIIFVIPFLFMLTNSLKDRKEASQLSLALPSVVHWDNFLTVFTHNNNLLLTAFKNSLLLTLGSVFVLVVTCAMSGYVLQRRTDKVVTAFNAVVMAGLMIPPAILPTITLMQSMHVYKTMFGMILIEVALQTPFTVMLYRGFIGTIPVELEEAGYIDGCNKWKMFGTIIFPLLKPVTSTVIILNAVAVFNDFTNPLYFLPGLKNSTVQLTLYNFMGQFESSYNLLFADVIIITIPMLVVFLIFNKRIVDGMVAGSVKG